MKHFLIHISILLVLYSVSSCKANEVTIDDGLVEVNYTESDSVILNPERGFYSQLTYYASTSTYPLSVSTVTSQKYFGRTLLLTMYYLDTFKDKPISDEFLSLIDSNMKAIREGGAKCILRFAYSDSETKKPWDAPQDIVLQHIQQLAPYLIEYSDIIYVMQAGFVGVWGEWYYTSNFVMSPSTTEDYAPRRAVLDALLTALPNDRMICVRTPVFKIKCFNLDYSDTLNLSTAFNKSDISRIACHNDCFLADNSDMGTFGGTIQKDYWKTESKYTVMGGETCAPSSYSVCDNALIQLQDFHWSYLNSGYNGSVLSSWSTSGCMSNITKSLGYRLVLERGKYTKEAIAGQEFTTKLTIKNRGFAAPVNPRGVELVFICQTDSSDKQIIKLEDDPRKWFSGGSYSISKVITLPEVMKGKTYALYLNLPDPRETLYNRPEYSIQLSNKNIWDETLGLNKLTTISIK